MGAANIVTLAVEIVEREGRSIEIFSAPKSPPWRGASGQPIGTSPTFVNDRQVRRAPWKIMANAHIIRKALMLGIVEIEATLMEREISRPPKFVDGHGDCARSPIGSAIE